MVKVLVEPADDDDIATKKYVDDNAGGAPTGADYLVGTTQAGLSAEIVVGTSPGGELGGTWASPTVDATHSGSAHHDAVTVGTGLDVTGQLVELDLSEVAAGGELGGFMDAPTVDATHSGSTHAATQAAAEATAAAALSGHTGDTSDAHDASAISFTPAGSIAATDVQAAIEEVAAEASGAPSGADYLVGTANGGLSAEIVVGTTPGGELGGTWASPTVDATHSGSAHHDAVTVGTGLDVTGQLVELDLSEVSAGGELAGTMDAPTVDQDHGGEYLGGDGDISVADTNYVTIATKTLTLAAGDVLIVECDFLILNNSGGTKTYTYALDVGGFVCENVDGTTQGASATNRAYRTFRASFALRSTSLAYTGVTVQWMAAAAANTSSNPALAQMRGTWNTSASNLTGSQAISVKVKSSANNATQTLTLLGWRIRKAT